MGSKQTGSRVEREFVNECGMRGWAALRCPSSGAGTDRSLPDILATRPADMTRRDMTDSDETIRYCEAIAVELKARSNGTPNLPETEIRALEEFAESAGAVPYVVVKPDQRKSEFDQWGCWQSENLNRTPKGYSILTSMWADPAPDSLSDLLGPVR